MSSNLFDRAGRVAVVSGGVPWLSPTAPKTLTDRRAADRLSGAICTATEN